MSVSGFHTSVYKTNQAFGDTVNPNVRVHVSGNTVNGQGGYDQHSNTHQENLKPPGGGSYPPRFPDNQVPAAPPPRREREYNWKLAGATQCSVSCGKGTGRSWNFLNVGF